MLPAEKEAIIALYEERYAKLGHDVNTLGWNATTDQMLRFEVLSDIGDLSNSSVCDVGCGFGDLAPYLDGRFTDVTYTGIDITPSLVAQASELRPDARFLCQDILADDFAERHDWFVLSGALNYRLEDNLAFSQRMLERMFALCERGVAINFLSSYVNFERELNYHHEPEAMFRFAKGLTRWVTLRHDYPLWEFTLYLYKSPQE